MPFIRSDLFFSAQKSGAPQAGMERVLSFRISMEPKLPKGLGSGFQLPLLYPFPTEQPFSLPTWGQQGELCFPLIAAD